MNAQDIYQKLGIDQSSEEQKNQIIAKIVTVVDYQFAGVVDELMDANQKTAFSEVVDTEDIDAIRAWIEQNVPDARVLYEAVLSEQVDDMARRIHG